jgi:hypothetical protein
MLVPVTAKTIKSISPTGIPIATLDACGGRFRSENINPGKI